MGVFKLYFEIFNQRNLVRDGYLTHHDSRRKNPVRKEIHTSRDFIHPLPSNDTFRGGVEEGPSVPE